VTDRRTDGRTVTGSNKHKIDVYDDADNARVTLSLRSLTPLAMLSGVTMGWLLRLVTGGTGGRGPPTVLEFLVITYITLCIGSFAFC